MPTKHQAVRPFAELDPSLGDEIAQAVGRRIAVSLIKRADGGTDIITHDRDTGDLADLISAVVLSKASVHVRPNPQPK